ncbi:hypothetical protein J1614_003777 [Plenodomus biglobosus]|nr:hypothetical protein J1614_003777 [Plenodomus biglobosus]
MSTHPPPPSLPTLPEELTAHILTHLSTSHTTLHALALTSRTLNRLATPLLYTSLSLQRHNFQYLRPLAVLLWSSARHRECVREVCVRRAYGGDLVGWPDVCGLGDGGEEGVCKDGDDALDSLIRQNITAFIPECDREAWFKRVRYGADVLPIASLLLRSLPHVSVMRFDGFMLVDPGVREGEGEWAGV